MAKKQSEQIVTASTLRGGNERKAWNEKPDTERPDRPKKLGRSRRYRHANL